jgi:uncharacterized protein (TIGR04255 family)
MTIAPATQVIITLQFASPIRTLDPLEIASLYNHLAAKFPAFEQVPPAGPMPYKLTQLDGSEPTEYSPPLMPRLKFTAADGSRVLLFQLDRLSYGWQRTVDLSEQDDYPGFDSLLEEYTAAWHEVSSWIEERTSEAPQPRIGEIAYVNGFLTRDVDDNPIRLSDIYCFIRPNPDGTPINGYSYSWNERLNVADGVLSVVAQGPVITPSSRPATLLTLTATFVVANVTAFAEDFLAVRRRIHETFSRTVAVGRRSS